MLGASFFQRAFPGSRFFRRKTVSAFVLTAVGILFLSSASFLPFADSTMASDASSAVSPSQKAATSETQTLSQELPTLKTLNPTHPRVFMSARQRDETAELLKTDENLQKLYLAVEREAQKYLNDPATVEYVIVGPRLLTQSRRCLRRVLALGTVYRLSEDASQRAAYLKRAMSEIRAAAAFPDWNPSHFLDTAEMTAAFAIAYDWFFDDLTNEEKTMMVNAIYEKGLVPGSRVKNGWKRSKFNWNQVCNAGMTMGALAIADAPEVQIPEKQDVIEKTVQEGIPSVGIAMKSFAPDGAWAEGPGYWCYTTLYTLFYVEALESSFGSDFGLCDFEGFSETANAQISVGAPNGTSFNFADAGAGNVAHSQLMWFANRFGCPEWTRVYLDYHRDVFPTAVWWYRPAKAEMTALPLDFAFREAEIATFRSSWTGPDAWFVGFKAGGNAVNHSHLELGNFILDHDSVRWAIDLGADNYNLPGYFGKLRWTYYRLATRGQNTLCVDGQNQQPKAFARIENFQSDPDAGLASADLSEAYADQLEYAKRSICLNRRDSFVSITDELGPGVGENVGKPIVWQFHTHAKITLAEDGKSAVLTQKVGKEEKKMTVVLEDATNPDVRFEVLPTTQGPDENPNKGVLRLAISFPATGEGQTLKVTFRAP